MWLHRLNPYAEHTYDGVPLNPLEVIFVKVKDFQLEGNWLSTHLAATYGRWLEEQVHQLSCQCSGTVQKILYFVWQ